MKTNNISVRALIVAMMLSAGVLVSFSSLATIAITEGYVMLPQEEKVKIKTEELPAAVKKTLDESFKGWTVVNAHSMAKAGSLTDKDYEIELKKNQETQKVKLDKDGKIIN